MNWPGGDPKAPVKRTVRIIRAGSNYGSVKLGRPKIEAMQRQRCPLPLLLDHKMVHGLDLGAIMRLSVALGADDPTLEGEVIMPAYTWLFLRLQGLTGISADVHDTSHLLVAASWCKVAACPGMGAIFEDGDFDLV